MKIYLRFIFRTLLLCILCFSFNSFVNAQSVRCTGAVIDSTSSPLIGATVVMLQAQDSVLHSYGISGSNGQFALNNIEPGEYLLQISFIGYGSYMKRVNVDGNSTEMNLGVIFLSPMNTLLEQVVVKAEHIPISINNDTIEYNAAAFSTKPNSPVEDLLKRLPGIEVRRDGSIRAQGEDVGKVLVDGKEFFGDDPKIATQNLPADIVDKVQVFDKKSEMAEFSGIDDGQEEKTINLSLKDGKKKGYFGNIEGGLGANKNSNDLRYKSKLNVNRFDNKLQLSALGMANNINDAGFSLNDYINFMGGMGSLMRGGSLAMNSGSGNIGIPLGAERPGITSTNAGGLNFNYDLNDKVEWQSSYFVNHSNNHTIQSISSQNLSGANSFTKLESSDQNSSNLNHRLNATMRVKFDSTSQMTWINRLAGSTGKQSSNSSSNSFDKASSIENWSSTNGNSDGSQFEWSTDLSLRKKLGKAGRIVSGNFNLSLANESSENMIDNEFGVVENSQAHTQSETLQDINSQRENNQYGIRINYTEPLSRKSYLGFSFNNSNYKTIKEDNYFDLDPFNPASRVRNTLLSNSFEQDYGNTQAGTSLRINGKRLKSSGGINFQRSELKGALISDNESIYKSFNYLLPFINLDYEIGSSKSLEFSYRTRIQEPNIEQLQPSIDNSDPYNLYAGNPDLQPEYSHRASFNLMLFDQFSFTSVFANLSAQYTLNKIVNKTTVDDNLLQFSTPINTRNAFTTNLFSSFETPLRFIKSKINLEANLSFNKGMLFVNGLENMTNRWTNNYTITLENRKKELVDLAIGASLGTNNLSYSVSAEQNQRYFDQSYFVDLSLDLEKNWNIDSSIDYTRYSGENFGNQNSQTIWRAGISKSFMKKDRATLKLNVYDILNQNKGISRTNDLNYVRESTSNVLGRYVMVSFNYRLSQFGGASGGFELDIDER